jgi:DNA-binding Lrp family transcriptional regulator
MRGTGRAHEPRRHCGCRAGHGRKEEFFVAIKAYVLIVTDPVMTTEVLAKIRNIEAVKASYEVMGPYDIVVEIEVSDLSEMPPILGEGIRRIDGIESTTSLVTIPERGL